MKVYFEGAHHFSFEFCFRFFLYVFLVAIIVLLLVGAQQLLSNYGVSHISFPVYMGISDISLAAS